MSKLNLSLSPLMPQSSGIHVPRSRPMSRLIFQLDPSRSSSDRRRLDDDAVLVLVLVGILLLIAIRSFPRSRAYLWANKSSVDCPSFSPNNSSVVRGMAVTTSVATDEYFSSAVVSNATDADADADADDGASILSSRASSFFRALFFISSISLRRFSISWSSFESVCRRLVAAMGTLASASFAYTDVVDNCSGNVKAEPTSSRSINVATRYDDDAFLNMMIAITDRFLFQGT
mmetsp:Transcript_27296/g.41844  ORF Transcript_27296/g.41844 Transcript_27296/m.41844 type:complete len:232 (+) Transcript_27296:723-1418(+)